MKPSQIRVFDGLRITTDHVNHLQGAFYSGLEDFREILGLGKAQVGLEVSAQDDGSVIIQPGLAFDFEKNRVPVEAPQTVKLNFGAPDEVKFICLKHTQVDDTPVEGHPTMIWDSSAVVVRTALPEEQENLVVLARVTQDADGKLQVCQEHCRCGHKMKGEPADLATTGGSAPIAELPPAAPSSAGSAAEPAKPNPEAAGPAPAPATPAPVSVPVSLKQGVVQLTSDPGASLFFKTVLAPALRKKMGADPIELSFTLVQADLNPGIAVAGFTTHCNLSADLTVPGAQGAPAALYRLRSAGNGEATVTGNALPQFGISAMQASPVPGQPGLLWTASDFTARGLAQFTFGQWLDAPEAARPALAAEVFTALELLVQLDRTQNGFQLSLRLYWSGKASEDTTHSLETQDLGFTWSIILGWKAIGS